jgi:ubiquinone/menaquinone biosynthesis C-methylase UbiE
VARAGPARATFPRLRGVQTFDKEDGDAETLDSIADESMDFVHSSHTLEHMKDPARALANSPSWWVCR